MIRLMKQVRFKILPSAIMDAVMRHSEDLEMKAEAAHALWSYTGVGGKPAQETVLDSSPYVLDFLKDGLAMARATSAPTNTSPRFVSLSVASFLSRKITKRSKMSSSKSNCAETFARR